MRARSVPTRAGVVSRLALKATGSGAQAPILEIYWRRKEN
jgi:hypothetical protein